LTGRLSPSAVQSLRQQFLFPQVLRHGNGALDFLTRLREVAHFPQQVSTNTVKQTIASQRRVTGERGYGIECIKPSGRALRHADGDCPVQRHDRRCLDLQQSVERRTMRSQSVSSAVRARA
jgi:hypothetical protein